MAPGEVRFICALAQTLLERDVPDLRREEGRAAGRFVAERLALAPSATRAGMAAVAVLLAAHARLVERASFPDLPPERRGECAARWAAHRLPGVGDYLDAIRGLALTWLYEERAA
jgi:hypothetical protein